MRNLHESKGLQKPIFIIYHLPRIKTKPSTIPTSSSTKNAAMMYFFLDFFWSVEAWPIYSLACSTFLWALRSS